MKTIEIEACECGEHPEVVAYKSRLHVACECNISMKGTRDGDVETLLAAWNERARGIEKQRGLR